MNANYLIAIVVMIALPALVSSALILFIVATNASQFEVLFRDVGLAAIGLALFLMHWKRPENAVG